jgi:hypothetical protein
VLCEGAWKGCFERKGALFEGAFRECFEMVFLRGSSLLKRTLLEKRSH